MGELISNSLDSFNNKFKDFDWFSDITIESGKVIIYVYRMSGEILSMLPDKLVGKQVLIHYTRDIKLNSHDEDLNVSLVMKLDELEKICGSSILQDIFYEIHDGANCVTNFSIKYPYVSCSMELLYNKYGFDMIYDELDG